eukprot:tig00020912_g15848.t1
MAQLPISVEPYLKMPLERDNKDLQEGRKWIQKAAQFFHPSTFPTQALLDLLRCAAYVRRARGQTVIQDGRIADRFFAILAGSVVMHIPEPGGRALLPRRAPKKGAPKGGAAGPARAARAPGRRAARRPQREEAAVAPEARAHRRPPKGRRAPAPEPAGRPRPAGTRRPPRGLRPVPNRTVVAHLFEGNLVGHMGVLRGRAWNATGVAEGPVHLLCFLKSDYDAVLAAYHLSRQANDIAEFLRTVPVFSRWPPAAVELVSAGVRPRSFERGAVIAARGDPGSSVFVVQEGEARLCDVVSLAQPGSPHKLRGGGAGEQRAVKREWEVGSAGPRELIGDQEAIHSQPYRFRVVAATRVVALQIASPEFAKHVNAHPQSLKVLTAAHEARDAARRERLQRIVRPPSARPLRAPLCEARRSRTPCSRSRATSPGPPPRPSAPRPSASAPDAPRASPRPSAAPLPVAAAGSGSASPPPGPVAALLRASASLPALAPPHAMRGPLSSPSDLARLGGPLPEPAPPLSSVPSAPQLSAAELAPVHAWAHGGAHFSSHPLRSSGGADAGPLPGPSLSLARAPSAAAPSPPPPALDRSARSPSPPSRAEAASPSPSPPPPVPPLALPGAPPPLDARPGELRLEEWLEWLPQGPSVLAAATGAPLSVLYSEAAPGGPPRAPTPPRPRGPALAEAAGGPVGLPELRPVSKQVGPGGGGGGRGGPQGSRERKLDPLGKRHARPPPRALLLSGY